MCSKKHFQNYLVGPLPPTTRMMALKESRSSTDPPSGGHECKDTGCGGLWAGQGKCVNMTKMSYSEIESAYDLSSDTDDIKDDRTLCSSTDSDKECCRCLRQKPCADNGCEDRGGRCVDILRANLKDENVFPRNTVDLDDKIEGEGLCRGSKSEMCCECYRLKGQSYFL